MSKFFLLFFSSLVSASSFNISPSSIMFDDKVNFAHVVFTNSLNNEVNLHFSLITDEKDKELTLGRNELSIMPGKKDVVRINLAKRNKIDMERSYALKVDTVKGSSISIHQLIPIFIMEKDIKERLSVCAKLVDSDITILVKNKGKKHTLLHNVELADDSGRLILEDHQKHYILPGKSIELIVSEKNINKDKLELDVLTDENKMHFHIRT